MIHRYAPLLLTLAPFFLQSAQPKASAGPSVVESLHNLPLAFERNTGQAPSATEFLARGAGYGVALSRGNARIVLRRAQTAAPVAIDLRLAGARPSLKAEK